MSSPHPHEFTREQKVGFSLLLIFGVMTIGLGVLQMRNNIYTPYVVRLDDDPKDQLAAILNDDEIRLQSIDTDQDGLNNYEEIYFYKTSAYLPDTDSDGISDKEEIEAGTDPLCAKGAACESADSAGPANVTSTGAFGDPGPAPELGDGQGFGGLVPAAPAQPQTAQDLDAILNNPHQIREILLRTGQVSREQLDQFSNEELLAMVQEIVAEQGGAGIAASVQKETPVDEETVEE